MDLWIKFPGSLQQQLHTLGGSTQGNPFLDSVLQLLVELSVTRTCLFGKISDFNDFLKCCRKSFSEYDPYLVAPTCLYLASKAEESTVQAKLLVFYMKKIRDIFRSLFMCKHLPPSSLDFCDFQWEVEVPLVHNKEVCRYLRPFHPRASDERLLWEVFWVSFEFASP